MVRLSGESQNRATKVSESLASASRAVPPARDEIEVSLLGPGFGECVVLHLGHGQWVVVDSCMADDGVTPAALEYLETIGVDPRASVSHVVISHADNDHIGGAAKLFSACESAELVYSAAFADRDVTAWIAAYSEVDPSQMARASTEIAAILESLPERGKSPVRAILDRTIIDNGLCKITALSPNDQRIEAFIASVVAQLPKAGAPRRRVAELTPNQACIALLMETPFFTAILGADLEEIPGKAWSHVIAHSITYGKAQPAVLIKVPHHGSNNADNDQLWQNLEQPPIAILATFNKSGKLPTPTDVTRILGRTHSAYSSSTFTRMGVPKSHDVDKVLKRLDVKRTRRFPLSGHIRVRISAGAKPVVELFGGAVHLSKVH